MAAYVTATPKSWAVPTDRAWLAERAGRPGPERPETGGEPSRRRSSRRHGDHVVVRPRVRGRGRQVGAHATQISVHGDIYASPTSSQLSGALPRGLHSGRSDDRRAAARARWRVGARAART